MFEAFAFVLVIVFVGVFRLGGVVCSVIVFVGLLACCVWLFECVCFSGGLVV